MNEDIQKVLVSEQQIQDKVKELALELTQQFRNKNPLVVCVLKGAAPFMVDLVKSMPIHLEMDFMDVSSYGQSTKSSGEVKIIKDLNTTVKGRDVLIVEDIIDSGLTLKYLVELFVYRQANSVYIVTLLDKPERRRVELKPDLTGFVVPDEFVVGYGLDYSERYRNIPYIGILKPEIYE